MVGGTGDIIRRVAANIVSLASLFAASVWRQNWKECGYSTVSKITYPWKLTVGDYAWVGDDAVLYTLGEINIGAHAVISQKGYLCTGSHDYTSAHFDINAAPIVIGEKCWLATDVFVAPGVTIGHGTVVGARSSVFKSLPANAICRGNPAVVTRQRVQKVTP
ncbi:putative acyl transferase [Salmonella enterica subsp. enterica serovar Heidelberg str. 92-0138]|nr:putative acyl transferase [Salmonella enterica subsp. enterica serovar Heidelberg str. 92-0138]